MTPNFFLLKYLIVIWICLFYVGNNQPANGYLISVRQHSNYPNIRTEFYRHKKSSFLELKQKHVLNTVQKVDSTKSNFPLLKWLKKSTVFIRNFFEKLLTAIYSIFKKRKAHNIKPIYQNLTKIRPNTITATEVRNEEIIAITEEKVVEKVDVPAPISEEVPEYIQVKRDDAHEAYIQNVRKEQQKRFVDNVLKDIERMKEKNRANNSFNNSTLGIIDTQNPSRNYSIIRAEPHPAPNSTASNSVQLNSSVEEIKAFSALPSSVQKFVGKWQLVEERFKNDSLLRLFDEIYIPPYGAVSSTLNGSTGMDWYVNYINSSILNQQPILNFKILRGCSSTSWVRLNDNQTRSVVTRPPKPPYDQMPRICLYRGTVVGDRIIGFLYSKDGQNLQDDKFYLLDLSNSSSGYSQIGNFNMYRI